MDASTALEHMSIMSKNLVHGMYFRPCEALGTTTVRFSRPTPVPLTEISDGTLGSRPNYPGVGPRELSTKSEPPVSYLKQSISHFPNFVQCAFGIVWCRCLFTRRIHFLTFFDAWGQGGHATSRANILWTPTLWPLCFPRFDTLKDLPFGA